MSYPPYGGGAPGGYSPAGGYPPTAQSGHAQGVPFQQPQQFAMPTPESASAAAYGGAPGGGMAYPSQPGLATQVSGMPSATFGYPSVPIGAMPNAPGGQQSFGATQGFTQPQSFGYSQQSTDPSSGYGSSQPSYGTAPPPVGFQSSTNVPIGQYGYQTGGMQQGFSPQQCNIPTYGGQYGVPGQHGAPTPASSAVGNPLSQPGYQQVPGIGSGPYNQILSNTSSSTTSKVMEEGTLKAAHNFTPEDDVAKLRKAMKGFGTDEKAIIDILGYRSNDQRQVLKHHYKVSYGRDLIHDLKSELRGSFENALVALMATPEEFDAMELHRAMKGVGTNEETLIEILCTRSNRQIRDLTQAYRTLYGRKLEDDVLSETSGHFRKLLVSMSVGGRMEDQPVDLQKAQVDAQKLYQAGKARWGTDENTFNQIIATQSYVQLRAVFDAYSKIAGNHIEHAIQCEMSGDVAIGFLTIVGMIRNKYAYFADRLYKSMKGAGTDDRTLIRVTVSRCEVDMKQIKEHFKRTYHENLEKFIKDDVSGDYRKLLMALVSPQ